MWTQAEVLSQVAALSLGYVDFPKARTKGIVFWPADIKDSGLVLQTVHQEPYHFICICLGLDALLLAGLPT